MGLELFGGCLVTGVLVRVPLLGSEGLWNPMRRQEQATAKAQYGDSGCARMTAYLRLWRGLCAEGVIFALRRDARAEGLVLIWAEALGGGWWGGGLGGGGF